MVTVIGDEQNKVVAYVEWRQVGQSGYDKLNGEFVWVQNLWIHPEYRGNGLLQQLIVKILPEVPDAKWCYFTREKYGHRMSKSFSRKSVEAIVKKELHHVV